MVNTWVVISNDLAQMETALVTLPEAHRFTRPPAHFFLRARHSFLWPAFQCASWHSAPQ